MIAGHINQLVKPTAIAAVGLGTSFLISPTPSASAEPCPDVQVVYARGTGEPAGIGPTGQAFVDNLRGREAGKSVDVYAVNYPASDEWSTGMDGIRDAGAHVVSMANSCPKTKMVLSGFSQGAAVMGFVTSASVPDGYDPATVPKPLSPDIADHVAAVVLFGTPNTRAMNFGSTAAGHRTGLRGQDDQGLRQRGPVCSDGMDFAAHNTYADDGAMIDKGASFAAARIDAASGGPAVVVHPPTGGGFGN
nr:cutinase family protein [Mycobacterium florentinum]